jgi:hypothetical protein
MKHIILFSTFEIFIQSIIIILIIIINLYTLIFIS